MEIRAVRRGIEGIVKVGRKHITFVIDENTTSKVGEIGKSYDGKYMITGTLLFVIHENRNEAIYAALRKAGFKLL